MNDDTIRIRRPASSSTAITPAKAAELRALYDELPDASAAAAEALGSTGPVPTGMALERFRELDLRVVEIIDRIKEILR